MVREVEHPVLGKMLQAGIVPTIPEGPGRIRWPGPDLGQHTEEVLSGLLGLGARDLQALRDAGAIR
jgi:crotonobetainyl-CoA:carnitine CoA-transferase CaiB-like acyl-CoA transferase